MSVVTRFAPSPTGLLHIGGVRTALFNWLFAKHHGGKYLLRIEDTDQKRSTKDAIQAIVDGLEWLKLQPDEKTIFQSHNSERHSEIVNELLSAGLAYPCYCSPEELQEMREKARSSGTSRLYDGKWRDKKPQDAPSGINPVIRFKTPIKGETIIEDLVQGSVSVSNQQLDDMILLRADRTPTYILSAVIDDHDMGVTHIIRGDDHLTNAFRQTQLFDALKWNKPIYAHIPLIHGPDGTKLSKRHGALGIDQYKEMGYLPEALLNYLVRLGWSHGNEEIFSMKQAIRWFDLKNVSKGAARINFDKLKSVNAHYIKETNDPFLVELIKDSVAEKLNISLNDKMLERLTKGISGLKSRVKTLPELVDLSLFYFYQRPIKFDREARVLLDNDAKILMKGLSTLFKSVTPWTEDSLECAIKDFAKQKNVKLGKIAQPLRAALTGTTISPSIFEVAEILGKQETIDRLKDIINN